MVTDSAPGALDDVTNRAGKPVIAPEELSDAEEVPIEEAPDDIADPVPAEHDDDTPPPEAMHQPPADMGDAADVLEGDALLDEMKALSAETNDDAGFMGMFDDVLGVMPKKAKTAAGEGGESRVTDLNDDMAVLLGEVVHGDGHGHKHDR